MQSALARRLERDDRHVEVVTRISSGLVSLPRELARRTVELAGLDAQTNQFPDMASHQLRAPPGVVVPDQARKIPAWELERLFQTFGRPKMRPASREHGTGLSLAIVRRIVEGHGGRLEVESTVGCGATLRFTVPAIV